MKHSFREAADARLASLRVDQLLHARILAHLGQGAAPARSPLKPRLAFILALLLVLALAAAFALTEGFGLLQVLRIKEAGRVPISPQAQQLVQAELARHQFPHTEVVIQEALYDGKMLRVLYSVRDMAADKPFALAGSDMPHDFVFAAADQDRISWKTLDYCGIDGTNASAVGITGNIAGELNGQVLTLSQFDLSGITVSNPFSVLLPIAGPNTPDSLRFELAASPLPGVRLLPLPQSLQLPDRSLQMTRALWSPIRVYIDLLITMAPGVPEAECHRSLWRWTMDAQLSDPATGAQFPMADVSSGYMDNAEFAPDVGDFRHRIIDPGKPVTMVVHLEFAAPDTMPGQLLLSAGEEALRIDTLPQP